MNNESIFYDVLFQVKINNYHGWDPYDILSTPFLKKIKKSQKFMLLLTQLNRVSPINLRNYLQIRKSFNSKAIALVAHALINSPFYNEKENVKYLIHWLIGFKSDEFTNYSIGFTHDIVLSHYRSKKRYPSLIISLFSIFAFIEYWNIYREKYVLDYIRSFFNLIQKNLPKYEDQDILFYSYNFDKFNEIYNATAKIGKFYSLYYLINPTSELIEKISKILNYLKAKQRNDGSWPYGEHIRYTDGFHTAFVLEAIWYMRQLIDNNEYSNMFYKGLDNYKNYLFKNNGQPLYFHPLYKPNDIRRFLIETDIRDCAMAIILFSLLQDKEYLNTSINWTIQNMYSQNEKYFYFYKNRLWTNKIEFIRWQSWMLYALSHIQQRK